MKPSLFARAHLQKEITLTAGYYQNIITFLIEQTAWRIYYYILIYQYIVYFCILLILVTHYYSNILYNYISP